MTPEQLKASILQRAMEGKLVPQDPNDEPASELLKKIKAEKEKLIKEGKIKRDKNETEIFRGDDGLHYEKFQDGSVKQIDVPFEIPESWEWARLNQVTKFGNFQSVKGNEIPDNAWVLDMEDIEKLSGILLKKVRKNGSNVYKSNKYIFNKNTILYGKLRPYLKKVIISDEAGYCTTELLPINVMNGIEVSFFRFILISPYFSELVNQSVYGVKMPRVGTDFFKSMLVPIPPLNEQVKIKRRIELAVSKVDYYHELFNTLRQLNNSFPEKLRKSILQYAMQGKLVPQDATDEPVEVLLEKIREEKQKLFTEGKLKKKDLQESIIYQDDDNSYYEQNGRNAILIEAELDPLQNGWCYKCLSDLIRVNTGLSYKKENLSFEQEGVRILRGGNISPLHLKLLSTDYFINKKYVSNPDLYLQKNQILTPVSTSLQHVGKFARVNETYENVVAGGFVFQLTPFMLNDIFSQFMEYALSSYQIYKQLINITNLSGQALYNIPKSKLMKIIIALPSLDEQERINSKLKLLFSNVQDLEKFL